jgi:hypothetical protein
MQIEVNELLENADGSIRKSLAPVPNATLERFEQPMKASAPRDSSEGGSEIDPSEMARANTDFSTVFSFEPASNITIEREGQSEKAHAGRSSTTRGIRTQISDEHP